MSTRARPLKKNVLPLQVLVNAITQHTLVQSLDDDVSRPLMSERNKKEMREGWVRPSGIKSELWSEKQRGEAIERAQESLACLVLLVSTQDASLAETCFNRTQELCGTLEVLPFFLASHTGGERWLATLKARDGVHFTRATLRSDKGEHALHVPTSWVAYSVRKNKKETLDAVAQFEPEIFEATTLFQGVACNLLQQALLLSRPGIAEWAFAAQGLTQEAATKALWCLGWNQIASNEPLEKEVVTKWITRCLQQGANPYAIFQKSTTREQDLETLKINPHLSSTPSLSFVNSFPFEFNTIKYITDHLGYFPEKQNVPTAWDLFSLTARYWNTTQAQEWVHMLPPTVQGPDKAFVHSVSTLLHAYGIVSLPLQASQLKERAYEIPDIWGSMPQEGQRKQFMLQWMEAISEACDLRIEKKKQYLISTTAWQDATLPVTVARCHRAFINAMSAKIKQETSLDEIATIYTKALPFLECSIPRTHKALWPTFLLQGRFASYILQPDKASEHDEEKVITALKLFLQTLQGDLEKVIDSDLQTDISQKKRPRL